jgi:hypothetical protein
MPHISMLEWIGYIASVVVAVSLMMSSLLKLRWVNLVGATCFSIYGFLIPAYPVGILNAFIAAVDIYYLLHMYSKKERFHAISVPPNSEYMACLFEEYRSEMAYLFPDFDFRIDERMVSFSVLRNLVTACVFIGIPAEDGTLDVAVDYVVPAYRDFKPGEFLFGEKRDLFLNLGFQRLRARSHDSKHDYYLQRMGFHPAGKDGNTTVFIRELA